MTSADEATDAVIPPMSRETIHACKMGMTTAIEACKLIVMNAAPTATRRDIINEMDNLKITRVPRASD